MRAPHPSPEAAPEQSLTLADIARHFSLPESTARYYCKRFAAFLPVSGEGRRRRYRQEALAVVAAIIEHMRTSRTASGVEDALRQQFPCTLDALTPVAETRPAAALTTALTTPQPEADTAAHMALRLLEQQTHVMEGIAASLQTLVQQQETLRQLSESAQQAVAENTALRREIADMRTLLRNAEDVHQSDLEQIRTWVGRILRTRRAAPPETAAGADGAV